MHDLLGLLFASFISMDREINKSSHRKRTFKRILTGVLSVLVFCLVLYGVRKLMDRPQDLSQMITGDISRGDIENTISASGVIKPLSEVLLTSPISTRIKTVHINNGVSVTAGERIMNLDTEFTQIEFQRLQEELKLKNNNVERLRLGLQKNLKEIEIDDEIKNLQVKNLKGLLSDAERLNKIGGATAEEVEQARQNLEIAKLEKKKLENEINYRKASFSSDVLNEEIQSTIQEKRLNELGKKIKLTSVKAPSKGVITWINNNIGTQVQEGDPLVKIANVSRFEVEATASDRHSEKISIGLPVFVRMGTESLKGEIIQILPSVKNNIVQFRVKLDEPDSKKLRPDMQVDVRIVTSRKENIIYMPNGPAFKGGRVQKIFVVKDGYAEVREVELGLNTRERVEVISGLIPGEKIILSDMSSYENRTKIPLK